MNRFQRLVIASIVIGLALSSSGQAQERKVLRKDLPSAVEKTVAAESQGATVRGFSTEVEGGKKIYEVQLTTNGHGKDISMDAQGNILEIEEEVQLVSLPAAVKDGLMKAAGKGTINKVESLMKKGQLVAYEASVKTGTKTSEIQVGPDGKKLAHAE